jgi:hypothetical protein
MSSLKPTFDPLAAAQSLMGKLAEAADHHFLLTWEGSKIPRGASIDSTPIGWTQNGMVTGTNGQQLGYYERLEEFGGPSGNRQSMLVSTNGATLTPPPGGSATELKTTSAAPAPKPR